MQDALAAFLYGVPERSQPNFSGCHALSAQRQCVTLTSRLALGVKMWHPQRLYRGVSALTALQAVLENIRSWVSLSSPPSLKGRGRGRGWLSRVRGTRPPPNFPIRGEGVFRLTLYQTSRMTTWIGAKIRPGENRSPSRAFPGAKLFNPFMSGLAGHDNQPVGESHPTHT